MTSEHGMNAEQLNKAYYDTFGRWYTEYQSYFRNKHILQMWHKNFDLLLEMTKNHPPRVLDFGCGTGWISSYFAQKGCYVDAIDVSRAMLNQVPHDRKIRTILGSLNDIPDEKYDIVIENSVLQHVHNYLDFVDKMSEVLLPGGLLYIGREPDRDYNAPVGFYAFLNQTFRAFDLLLWMYRQWGKVKEPSPQIVSPHWNKDGLSVRIIRERVLGQHMSIIFVHRYKWRRTPQIFYLNSFFNPMRFGKTFCDILAMKWITK